MTVLSRPRHPFIEQGLADARRWCAGHTIDDRPALVHAVRVAVVLGDHVPDAPPELVAAVLLHDAPEFAPPDLDLDTTLRDRYTAEVPRIIRALQVEHQALDEPDPPVDVTDRSVLLASTADKVVALTSLLRRARASGDSNAFFAVRPGLLRLLPHFNAFQHAGRSLVPADMSRRLRTVLDLLEHATADVRPTEPHHAHGAVARPGTLQRPTIGTHPAVATV